jgi:hypothetical protein
MKDDVLTTLNVLFEDDETVVIGLLSPQGMIHHFAMNKQKIAEFVAEIDQAGPNEGIYVNLQHHSGQRRSIKREDVDRYKFLLVDIDRKVKTGLTVQQDKDRKIQNDQRPKDDKLPRLPYVPATQEDLDQLAVVREKVITFLREEFGVEPTLVACTGNGWHVLYALEGMLPNDKSILSNVLLVLSEKYDSDEGSGASIDRSTADEPQLVRMYGTWNRKGAATKERPHRQSYIVKHAIQPPVTKKKLQALSLEVAEDKCIEAASGDFPELDEDFDYTHLLDWAHERLPEHLADLFTEEASYEEGGIRHVTLSGCVNAGHKHRGDKDKTQLLIGQTLGYKCFSDDCEGVKIGDFLRKLWVLCGEKYPYPIFGVREGHGLDLADDDDPQPPSTTPEAPKPIKWERYAKALDIVREGKESYCTDDGKIKTRKKPKHVVDEEIFQFVLTEIISPNCKLYFDAYGYLFAPGDNRIFNWSNDNDAYEFLANLHLRLTQADAKLVRENVALHILVRGEHSRIEKFGCMKGDAIYVNDGRGGMFKLTPEEMSEVPNGTDGVLMLAPEVKPWPTIVGNEARINAIAKQIGYKGGRIADSALCRHFTGKFEEGSLTTSQYQQLLLLRYLSLFVGNTIALRPILMSMGEQGSGKSTLWEKFMWLLEGEEYESGALPSNLRSFIAAITNSQVQVFDNIDGMNFSNPKSEASSYIDLMCKASTGGQIPIAQLYETNVSRTYSLRCDLFFTARVNPFPSHRSDLARRMLFFPVRKPETDEYVTVEQMKADLHADAEEMKLETLVRLHYILKAIVANREAYAPLSEMHSYENWTRRIAVFEGWGEEMVAIWQGCKTTYQERVTEDSPLIDAVRRWIGSDPEKNAGRWTRASEIYKELSEKYYRQVTDAWRSSAVFGKRIKENFSALRLLGIEKKVLDGVTMYRFDCSPTQVEQCTTSYEDSVPSWRLFADREDAKLKNLDFDD